MQSTIQVDHIERVIDYIEETLKETGQFYILRKMPKFMTVYMQPYGPSSHPYVLRFREDHVIVAELVKAPDDPFEDNIRDKIHTTRIHYAEPCLAELTLRAVSTCLKGDTDAGLSTRTDLR